MMTRFALFALLLCVSLQVKGQAAAEPAAAEVTTYTFTTPAAPGKVARFDYAVPGSFSYTPGEKKKPLTLAMPASRALADLVGWVRQNKALKSDDVLVIDRALMAWDSARATMGFSTTASGLKYKIIEKGSGKLPEAGKRITVHYRGTLENGKQFDSSFDRGQPITFTLGQRQVIQGWEEGLLLFPVGSKGRLRIPPALAYGARSTGTIPANSTLFFDVEIVAAD